MVDSVRFTLPSTNLFIRVDREITAEQYDAIQSNNIEEIANLTGFLSQFADLVCGTKKVEAVKLAVAMANLRNDASQRLTSAAALQRLVASPYQANFKFDTDHDGLVRARVICPDNTVLEWTAPPPSECRTLMNNILGPRPAAGEESRSQAPVDPDVASEFTDPGLTTASSRRSQTFIERDPEFELGYALSDMPACYHEVMKKLTQHETFKVLQKQLDAQRLVDLKDRMEMLVRSGLLSRSAVGSAQAPSPTIDDRIFAPHLQVRRMGDDAWLVTYQAKATNHDSPFSTYDATFLLSGKNALCLYAA